MTLWWLCQPLVPWRRRLTRCPLLRTQPAAPSPADRQAVSCGLDCGFLAAGGADRVAGQAAGAMTPGAARSRRCCWSAVDGRRMDTMGEDTSRLSSGTNGTTGVHRTEEVAGQPTCTFGGVYACRLSVGVWPRSEG